MRIWSWGIGIFLVLLVGGIESARLITGRHPEGILLLTGAITAAVLSIAIVQWLEIHRLERELDRYRPN